MVFQKNKNDEFQHSVVKQLNQKSEFDLTVAESRKFSQKIISWYGENKRNLPWRNTKDPYKIWLSEIILQQTRVRQGLPYYLKFVKQLPTVFSLAKAKEQEVLSLWQGLGYYTRARNLHQCAKDVVEKFQGVFPNNFNDLQRLRGIGSYTAAAIASISFREPVAVVDGNVFRVLSRIFGIDKDISQSKTKDFFFALANELMSKEQPDEFNQGVMEFGATHCLPKNPLCRECIFSKQCIANKHDLQTVLPVKSKKQKIRKRYFYYFVSHKSKKIWMKKRTEKDIWRGLFDFYLIETTKPVNIDKLGEKDENLGKYKLIAVSKTYKHILSHQHLKARFISVKTVKLKRKFNNDFKYYTPTEIKKLPKPVLVLQYLRDEGILD
ncbi:MAG: A/G-specific adenine glycosylase [Bacteroidota bacterium]